MVIAHCDRCGGIWWVGMDLKPESLKGVCKNCIGDTNGARPLQFMQLPLLPKGWITE